MSQNDTWNVSCHPIINRHKMVRRIGPCIIKTSHVNEVLLPTDKKAFHPTPHPAKKKNTDKKDRYMVISRKTMKLLRIWSVGTKNCKYSYVTLEVHFQIFYFFRSKILTAVGKIER